MEGLGWEEEKSVPWSSRWLFGRGHEGWCIEAEAVTLPPLPISSEANGTAPPQPAAPSQRQSSGVRKCTANGSGDFVDRASKATSLQTTTAAPPAKPYDSTVESIPSDVLRGDVRGSAFSVDPVPVAAFWQWKTLASAVSRGKVISVKPGNDLAGIGSGPALSRTERMVLFFVGGGYHSGHAPQGPLSWTVCRQTSLRVLGVNFRKATKNEHAFPAALQDALAAWVYVTKRLGFRPENVILLGDSAGAGLALSLQLYLSALQHSTPDTEGAGLGRARKLVLHSPMTDLTLAGASFTANEATDIITPYMCSLARDNYLRHMIPIPNRPNPSIDALHGGEGKVDAVAGRYDIDPYALTPRVERSQHHREELTKLARELPETIVELGAFHPLFCMGRDARTHRYLAQALLLLKPQGGEGGMEVLVTAGTGEIFYDQIKLLTRNLLDLNHTRKHKEARLGEGEDAEVDGGGGADAAVKVSLVECVDWHHVFAFMNFPGEIKAQVDDVSKTFMLA